MEEKYKEIAEVRPKRLITFHLADETKLIDNQEGSLLVNFKNHNFRPLLLSFVTIWNILLMKMQFRMFQSHFAEFKWV